jgi:hypothetical protein
MLMALAEYEQYPAFCYFPFVASIFTANIFCIRTPPIRYIYIALPFLLVTKSIQYVHCQHDTQARLRPILEAMC